MTDLINGIFESVASLFILLHVLKLYRDKEVKGVALTPFFFFTLWGFWNLIYYPSVNCWYSFFGGIAVVLVNTIYTGMLMYYSRKQSVPVNG